MAAAKLEKTRYPGVYKRGSRYVVVYRANGAQRKESAGTLEEARRMKRFRDRPHRGEFRSPSERQQVFATSVSGVQSVGGGLAQRALDVDRLPGD